jgi:hypothetical protein
VVKVRIPEATESTYYLYGGGYDGSAFICGPGLPDELPKVIVVEDDAFIWRYEHSLDVSDGDPDAYGGYALASEQRK